MPCSPVRRSIHVITSVPKRIEQRSRLGDMRLGLALTCFVTTLWCAANIVINLLSASLLLRLDNFPGTDTIVLRSPCLQDSGQIAAKNSNILIVQDKTLSVQ
jgi:hypothetical protein